MVIGLRSGGLPEACKSKKLSDKIDLMVAMRDVLLHEAIDNNGVECTDFKQLYTIGVHSYGKIFRKSTSSIVGSSIQIYITC